MLFDGRKIHYGIKGDGGKITDATGCHFQTTGTNPINPNKIIGFDVVYNGRKYGEKPQTKRYPPNPKVMRNCFIKKIWVEKMSTSNL